MTSKDKKVLIGMSGGVDSSVAAYILKKEGYQVVGVTFWLWDYPGSPEYRGEENACCSTHTAELIAHQLEIPHQKWDFSEQFYESVVKPARESYLRGETPNPCALCNRFIRFDLALDRAQEQGFDYVATGHHVRKEASNGKFHLLKGIDSNKDQSYFLYSLGQAQLRRALFPVGHYHKEQIYNIARDNNLVSAHLSESQDLCFITSGDYRNWLRREVRPRIKPGKIVDTEGNTMGEHKGFPFYTIGQRRGLGLETNKAYYVVRVDPEQNLVVVGDEKQLYSKSLLAKECQWVSDTIPDKRSIQAQIRYRSPATEATFTPLNVNEIRVEFSRPQKAITAGQKVVLFDGDEVLGGGTIKTTNHDK